MYNYCRFSRFHKLLFLEQIATRSALSKLARSHVFFRREGLFLVLDMEGLSEMRPSVIVGDKIVVTQPWKENNNNIEHVGFIHQVTMIFLYFSFNHFEFN